jgi:sulfoxide reductase heme-binding subunit YedZ
MKKFWLSRWTKVLLFSLCLIPFLNLLWRVYRNDLTANPIEFITHRTGDWTIRFLLITLAITPLRGILNQPQLIRFRRMLGLFAFFYGCLHFTTWIGLDKNFDTQEMWEDVIKRRFITAGMTGLLLMTPLAVTSTAGWVRRLGYRRWQMLHRLIYLSALAGVVHYYWLVKSDTRLPLMYGGILAALLLYRLATGLVSARKSVPARRPLRPPADARG